MRELLIAGNWKMNCTVDEAVALASSLRENLGSVIGVEVAICPPFVALAPVRELLGDTAIKLGAQDAFYLDSGAYTGAVSPAMLAPLCRYVIVGHSERRQFFGETDDVVARKVAAVARHKLDPILCVGETLAEFEAGKTIEVLQRQLSPVLAAIEPLTTLVVAYEPVWAIGSGRSAEPSSVNHTVAEIRGRLRSDWGARIADGIRILYGGSVSAGNVADYIRMDEIDGALVGGASLRAQEFCDIVFQSASVRR